VTTNLERSHAASDGFGAWFAARIRPSVALGAAVIAGLIAAGVSLILGTVGIGIGGVIGAAVGIGIGVVIVRWRGQLDGDALGAVVELTVAAVLVATAIVVTAPIA
jgi:cobalamin synthase